MRNIIRLVFAGLAATIVLSFAVGGATARRIEMTERAFLVRWSPLIFEAVGNRISCPVTLEGSFHSRTLSKVSGQLVGYITRAFVQGEEPPCQGGQATVLSATLPWHVLYVRFTGTLPRITTIRLSLRGAAFRIHDNNTGFECLTTTTQNNPAMGDIGVTAEGVARTLTALPEFTIPLAFPCFGSGKFEGTGEVFTQITPQVRITVRLVQ
jgi:hypothetical protein